MTATQTKKAHKAEAPAEFAAYKGFDKNLQCRGGYQYEVGKTYTHEGPVKQCDSGFHACQNPLDVLDYYGIGDGNRFAKVTLSGEVDRSDDRKWAAEQITIGVELRLPDLIAEAIKWVMDACKGAGTVDTGDYSQLATSGYSSKLEVSGAKSVAAAVGPNSLVKAVAGTPIAICEYDASGAPIGFATGIAGAVGVPADTWLKAKGGKLVPA